MVETLVEVKLRSNGNLFGYSYSLGIKGDSFRKPKDTKHLLSLWMLNKRGDVVFRKDYDLGLDIQPPHQHDKPICHGVVLQETTDTVSFRLSPTRENNFKLEQWHLFSATTDEAKVDLLIDFREQKHYEGGWIETIISIPNTEYYLLELRQYINEESKSSKNSFYGYISDSLIYLMNPDGEVVWSDVNPGDLRIDHKTKIGKRWDSYLDHHALINYDESNHQFSIKHIKNQQIINYEIKTERNKQLQVIEKSRVELKLPNLDNAEKIVEQKQIKFLYQQHR